MNQSPIPSAPLETHQRQEQVSIPMPDLVYSNPGYPNAAFPNAASKTQGDPESGYHDAGYPGYSNPGYNPDDEGEPKHPVGGNVIMGNSFDDKVIRSGFVRRVYFIVSLQLSLTFGIMLLFRFVKPLATFGTNYPYTMFVAILVGMAFIMPIACCEGPRRKFPLNMIVVLLFSVCLGVFLGIATLALDSDSIFIAAGLCLIITVALTLFAMQTKFDFTLCNGLMLALLVILIMASFFVAILGTTRMTEIGLGSLGALLFSIYIIIDTQMITGGKHKYSFNPEDYVFAATVLYLDIINLFLRLLQIVAAAKR